MTTRRQMLCWGSLATVGLSVADLLRAGASAAVARPAAKSCILLFLEGGPAHQDLWDMKPTAPAEVRGEFQPIDTSAAGIQVCEHLPLLARQMHHMTLVRSVHHTVVDHNAGAYYALTGRSPVKGGQLIVQDEIDNFPPFGSVVSRLRPIERRLPPFVHVPEIMSNNGYDLPGQRAGFFGAAYDPFVTGDASAPGYQVPGLGLPADVPSLRLDGRNRLHELLDNRLARLADEAPLEKMQAHYRQAFQLLTSTEARRAFDLSAEPDAVRRRYGLPDRTDRSVEARKFGGLPHFGQCLLLARRLVEAGVRLVTVGTGRRLDQAWDTHRQHFPLLKQSLLPYFDRGFSALLEDLDQCGLLGETLVVAMGEFGRTPKLGQITSGAGADAAGRDHWPHCYTVLFAGGGVRGGAVYGQSDRWAAHPARDAVTPEDIAATIYRLMGIDPESRIIDPLDRPQPVALGRPIDL
ncbi:MAG TPA: DUF1501 domain-containing protein [Pirellulales bacterium]|nr:DUF1501 domain-containing protein [Pirellulales bacterium]